MNALAALPADHPMMLQWNEYKLTFEFSNTRQWALHENTVEGSLWAAFSEGFQRAIVLSARALTNPTQPSSANLLNPNLPDVVYDTIRVQRHMKDRGYNVDMGTVSKILDAVVSIYDADKAKPHG